MITTDDIKIILSVLIMLFDEAHWTRVVVYAIVKVAERVRWGSVVEELWTPFTTDPIPACRRNGLIKEIHYASGRSVS